MFLELKVSPNDVLLDTDVAEVHSLKEVPTKTRLMFSTRHALKKQVWENARKNGWLHD